MENIKEKLTDMGIRIRKFEDSQKERIKKMEESQNS